MKKYKLIKEYPGSPELGTVVDNRGGFVYFDVNNPNTNNTISQNHVENNPKYWEKITEIPVGTKVVDTNPETKGYTYEKLPDGKWKIGSQDYFTISESSIGENKRFRIVEKSKPSYEILKLINISNDNLIFDFTKFNLYYNDIIEGRLPKHLLIHSVQRINDGEIFTLNDTVANTKSPTLFKGKIFKFEIVENTIEVHYDGYDNIESISKVKSPLFVTEDKVEIYKGDEYCKVNNHSDYSIVTGFIAEGAHNNYKGLKFSSKEKAEEYVILNKPCLSINDLKNLFDYFGDRGNNELKLKQLVKNKIKDV